MSAADQAAADAAYREAIGLADGATKAALARDHVADLLRRRVYSLALLRCTEHTEAFPDDQVLLLTRAETRCALADFAGAERDADGVGSVRTVEDQARLHRVRGLAAADRGDHHTAERLLDDARALFESSGRAAGAAVLDRDKVMLGVRRGDPHAVAEALSSPSPQTPAERMQLARALKRELRYEEALRALRDPGDVDPALLPLLRDEAADLRRLTRQDEDGTVVGADPDSPRFDRRLQHSILLAVQSRELVALRPAEAAVLVERSESVLVELRPLAETDAEQATWHLAAGELELARHDLLDRAGVITAEVDSAAHEAVGHFRRAAALAATTATTEVRLRSLRLLGHAQVLLDAGDEAQELWREAYRIEEQIVARQVSDEYKVRMLLAAGDEHDERIKAAAAAIDRHGMAAAAAVVVALEAARGQTITDAIGGHRAELPRLGDIAGAYRWIRNLTRDLPRSQLVWLMYAAPDRLHHVLVGRTVVYHHATRPRISFRSRLVGAVGTLASFWDRITLERSVVSGEFDSALTSIGEMLGLATVVRELPSHVTRIAVVAHGVLSQVPIAALPVVGTADRLVHRFAVSDLPSLSARRPLAHRSLRRRGETSLLIRPEVPEFPQAADLPGRTKPLYGDEASPGHLRRAVSGHRIVRVDSHGTFTADDSWLQLAPDCPDGRLRPEDLKSMDLESCGTIVLGACESGMAHRVGRDEPIGFVRAAMQAGAAAAVGARWIAEDPVAAGLLDQFEHYLRYLPRDVALQRAQLDVCAGRVPHAGSPEHPARWACWTLYGDAGWQTGAGPVRRWLRAKRQETPCRAG